MSETKTTYLCVAPNYWGRGDTVERAKKECRAAGGSLKRYIVFASTDPTMHVDDFGTVWAAKGTGLREVARHGLPKKENDH